MKRIFNRERLHKLANMEPFDSKKEAEDAFYKIDNFKIDNCIRHSKELLENYDNLAWLNLFKFHSCSGFRFFGRVGIFGGRVMWLL